VPPEELLGRLATNHGQPAEDCARWIGERGVDCCALALDVTRAIDGVGDVVKSVVAVPANRSTRALTRRVTERADPMGLVVTKV
jgi:hypothetical protein